VSSLPPALRAALVPVLGASLDRHPPEPLRGGCINEAWRVRTDAGAVFVKTHAAPPAGYFEGERAGLEALAAVEGGPRVPRVLAVLERPAALVLEDLGHGRPSPDFDARLGEALARLHASAAPTFGFSGPTFCGTTRQDNTPTASWVDFYRDRRLAPLLAVLRRRGDLDRAANRCFDALLDRLPDRLGALDEPPALTHGDLWSGNVHVCADGAPALVDPAAAFTHREAELGMMLLFGGFGPRVFAAYEAMRPLEPAWRARMPLYSLYHVLNHAVLFGGGYLGEAVGIARRFG
jgi:protein-ribulosamine 3-kinase